MLNLSAAMDTFAVVAKRALFFVWPFGLCAWLAGAIFVDRRRPAQSYRALDLARGWLKTHPACKFWFFPEGTRNQEASRTRSLLPFKRGAFYIAISCQTPIIPVVNGPYHFVKQEKLFFAQGTVRTEVLPPIVTTGLTEHDIESLMERTHRAMQEKYRDLFLDDASC